MVKPTLTVEQATGQSDPSFGTNMVQFKTTFSEAINVASFACEDITLTGSATTSCSSVVHTGALDGTEFNINIVATTDGTVIASVPGAAVHDVL